MKVSVIGLGKLGMPVAETMASVHEVNGFDTNPQIKSTKVNIKSNIQDTVADSEIIFIAVPTPHDKAYGGELPSSNLPVRDFDYTALKKVLVELKNCVTEKQLILNISTVLPCTLRPMIEEL